MVMKRKTISKLATAITANSKDSVDVDEDMDTQIVPVEEPKALTDKEQALARTKEMKGMSAEDLKQLLLSNGLETGKKDVMIATFLKHEAKARAVALAQKAKIRAVVVQKKQELEALPTPQLTKLCEAAGFKGVRSKEERVQRLLVQWQENDGVDKALAEITLTERKQELAALDDTKLQKLCNKIGVDPFVKEIMVDRISKRESETGCYARPSIPQENEAPKAEQKVDMVEALLANEAMRKKEMELRSQQEDAAAIKMKEFKSLSIEDLKKRLTKKGLEASGKKEEMLRALFLVGVQEEAAAKRNSELASKALPELKEILSRLGLETGSKEQMIKTMLAHEAKCREDLKAFELKVDEVVMQKKELLETQTNASLKDLCVAKGLPVGGGKEERVERLVEDIRKNDELNKVVSMNIRMKRKDELMSMDKPTVLKLCEKVGVDPLVKDIMVERIISQETEGEAAIVMTDEPATKKARVSKK